MAGAHENEDVPGEGAVTSAQEAKAELYKELGYRLIGMVGQDLTVARPMVKAKGTSFRSSDLAVIL
ncbi:MAG: hypothetical protein M3461_06250 [Pseudomonadota bacterium]|nr:hypothetical protein [Pseudomonadota bacterium]